MANLSKIKRDSLIDKIENLKMKNKKDEDTTLLLNEIINELTGKKYGLVWELHEENVDKKMETAIPVFDEIKEREICGNPDDKKINFLLEGDNLHSLKLLEKTHKGRIDVIYIDPPYNTGNSFTYNDENIELNDNYRHSKWISFMAERLEIARNLLSEQGIIFISIDDNEQANLKLLCDSIFDEKNFFAQIIVQSNKRGQTYKQIAKTHEYILIYTKTPEAEFNEILKSEDGSNRKFILCTNNEIKEDKLLEFQEKQLGSKPQKYTQKQKKELSQEEIIKRDLDIEKWEKDASTLLQTEECQELGICRSATYQRLKTVITGETIKGNKYSDGIPANLKYYKTDFVDKYSDDPDYFIEDKLMEHIVEMIQLENGIRIDNDKYVVLLTDEEAEEFESNIDSYHPIKIYIDGTVFLSQKIKNKLDTEGVEILPIPDYYFAKDIKGGN